MDDTVFIVIQGSVYRHAIKGVFSSLSVADIRAKDAIMEEHDHFHHTQILKTTLDLGVRDAETVYGYMYDKGSNEIVDLPEKWWVSYGE